MNKLNIKVVGACNIRDRLNMKVGRAFRDKEELWVKFEWAVKCERYIVVLIRAVNIE